MRKLKLYGSFLFFSIVFIMVAKETVCAKPKEPRVAIVKQRKGDFQMLVEGKPYIVKGVCYNPIPVGKNYLYNFWGAEGKPWLNVDGPLMKALGVNTIRLYQEADNPEQTKALIRDLYENFGIRTIMTHYLGFWEYPVSYGDEGFQKRITEDVLRMVRLYKDEPGILTWCLGNENNFSWGPQQINPWTTEKIEKFDDPYKKKVAKATLYYQFVEKVARAIKKIDKDHPVMLGNGDLADMGIAKKQCPSVDVLGATAYRGKNFGSFFRELNVKWGKPIIFTEFGCDSFNAAKGDEDQSRQAEFIKSQWQDISRNLPGRKNGEGNCLGGCVFEWHDEWWKASDADINGFSVHDTTGQWSNPAYYFDMKTTENLPLNMNEEWWGIISLDAEVDQYGNNKRNPKTAYEVLKDLWKEEQLVEETLLHERGNK